MEFVGKEQEGVGIVFEAVDFDVGAARFAPRFANERHEPQQIFLVRLIGTKTDHKEARRGSEARQALRRAQDLQKSSAMIQEAIDKGLPKTKISKIPFRMEMSAFARHEGSLPVIGDIGMIWPVFALRIADALGIELEFMSYKQETEDGKAMREWIVKNVKPLDREKMLRKFREWKAAR